MSISCSIRSNESGKERKTDFGFGISEFGFMSAADIAGKDINPKSQIPNPKFLTNA